MPANPYISNQYWSDFVNDIADFSKNENISKVSSNIQHALSDPLQYSGDVTLFFCGTPTPISEDEFHYLGDQVLDVYNYGDLSTSGFDGVYCLDLVGTGTTTGVTYLNSELEPRVVFAKLEALGTTQPFFENFLTYWGYNPASITRLDYDTTAKSFGVNVLTQSHYDTLGATYPILILTNHTIHTLPYWGIEYNPSASPITFKKHNLLIDGIEMLVGGDMSRNTTDMSNMFYGTEYADRRTYLYDKYGSAFVQNAVSEFLAYPTFPIRMECTLTPQGITELLTKYPRT
jgi:hypothetical protein